MKKLILSVGVLLLLAVGVLGFNKSEPIKVVKEHGFMVLKDNDKEKSTIVIKVTDPHEKGTFGENVIGYNIYDKSDVVTLERNEVKEKKIKKGDVLLVTFDGDWVEKAVKNKYNVGNKVEGQKVKE
jgi:hypothetical protein